MVLILLVVSLGTEAALVPGMTLKSESAAAKLTREAKKWVLASERLVRWQLDDSAFAAPKRASSPLKYPLWSTRVSLLGGAGHPVFEAGKRHNVALAAPAFDGLRLSSTRAFSFWRTLGRVTRERGYRHGMELSGGCIVPSIGGGLCLLARVLFQGAVFSGLTILERHGHSLHAVAPPAGVPLGFDATLLYPFIDLRFAPEAGEVHVSARVKDDAFIVTFTGDAPLSHRNEVQAIDEREAIEPEGRMLYNRLLRRRLDSNGAQVSADVVAINRTKWLSNAQQHRSCLTCGEAACRSRVTVPA